MGALTLPGIGPIVAAGWVLSGAVAGALTGDVIGALVDAGIPETEAERLAEDHRLGRSVLSVRADGEQIAVTKAIMDAAMPLPERPSLTESGADGHLDHGKTTSNLAKALS